jgi:hypothetical protein
MDESFKQTPDRNQEVKNKIINLYKTLPKEKIREVYDAIAAHGNKIRSKYPECQRYEIFHALAGSTMDSTAKPGYYIKEDFPGEDSIEEFVNNLVTKYSI